MTFADLTWEDLKEWAGDRVVGRGKSYKRQVEDLRVTADGALLAWVLGGDRYATRVRMDADGDLSSQCTCPYGESCKHAVATILAYLDAVKDKQAIPNAEPDDERLANLAADEGALDDDDDLDSDAGFPPRMDRGDDLVRKHLEGLSKAELVSLVLEGRDVVTAMRQQLTDRADLQDGNMAKLIASTRKEIEKASRNPGWQNHWKHGGYTPDYSSVKQRLKTLLDAGQADAVVELGAYLMDRGIEQVGQSNDEGETGQEIAECMKLVFKAVARSSKTVPQQILWEIDLRLQDNYCILDGIEGRLDLRKRGTMEDWSHVANTMAERMAKMPMRAAVKSDAFSSSYAREHVMRWIMTALERSDRHQEIIPLLERETEQTHCYVELVKRLVDSGQPDKALEWARKGFSATKEKLPGIANQLEGQLRELAAKGKNAPLVAAYRATEFFDQPNLQTYSELEKAAIKANVWDAIRGTILNYLETGRRPDISPPVARRKGKASTATPAEQKATTWPLPETELPPVTRDSHWFRFPDTSTLIDIAIKEKRYDDVLRWYRAVKTPDGFGRDHVGANVADAVQSSHPDEALGIWKHLVAGETRHANVAAYQTAGAYLAKIRKLCERANRTAEWKSYLAELREQNARRPRMLDVLNSLEGRRTSIVQSSN